MYGGCRRTVQRKILRYMNWLQLLSTERPGTGKKNNLQADRSEFEKDTDRIIFSHAFRKLQDKTQVVPLPEQDFVHNRLTHSMEVSSVGRSLGKITGKVLLERHPEIREAGLDVHDFGNIISAACLAHDIGNPPFGHSGENGISIGFKEGFLKKWESYFTEEEWYDLSHFEGNAQGFRILMQKGLQPTAAVLGAFVKYPCTGLLPERDKQKKSQRKFNFYMSEKAAAEDFVQTTGLHIHQEGIFSYCRHPLVFLTEAADDICYLIIDLEDAARMKILSEEKYIALLQPLCGDSLKPDKLRSYPDLNERLGIVRALAIRNLIEDASEVFLQSAAEIAEGRYEHALTDKGRYAAQLQLISDFSIEHIYNSQRVVELQASGFEILPRLTELFSDAALTARLEKEKLSAKQKNLLRLLPGWRTMDDISPYETTRRVLDFVSGLTDRHALLLHKKLMGVEI